MTLKYNKENALENLSGYEIVHFVDDEHQIAIASNANRIYVKDGNIDTELKLNLNILYSFLKHIRLFRRLLRLDKSNVYPILSGGKLDGLIIIYQTQVFHWSYETGISQTLQMDDCRNLMHCAISRSDSGNIYFGEYGSNKNRDKEVSIFCSVDGGRSWNKPFIFPPKKIKHIHNVQWDTISQSLWISTGDADGESYILQADENFENVKWYGDGSQLWRTCHLFFTEDEVIWGMDSPLIDCQIVSMNRKSETITKLCDISGPAWHGKKYEGVGYFLTTSVEPGVNCLDNKSKIYYSKNLKDWRVCFEAPKDRYHPVYFKFGSIFFSEGSDKSFYVGFEGLDEYDGRMIHISELENKFEC